MNTAFIGIGGNLGDVRATFHKAYHKIAALKGVSKVRASQLYQTSPVSHIEQPLYLNAALEVTTTYSCPQLFHYLEVLETLLGKEPKPKSEPRPIDLDLLLYNELYLRRSLEVPHPRFLERLFVLIPLLDLTQVLRYPISKNEVEEINLPDFIRNHPNPHRESITLLGAFPSELISI